MMEAAASDNEDSPRGVGRSSIDYREEDLGMADEENAVAVPRDYEIESTPPRPRICHGSGTATLVFGASLLVIGVLISLFALADSNHVQQQSDHSMTVVDDANGGNGGYVFTPIGDNGTSAMIFPPPTSITLAPTMFPTLQQPSSAALIDPPTILVETQPPTVAPTLAPTTTFQPTLPMHLQQGCLSSHLDNENMRGNNRLYTGQYICDDAHDRFQFGVDIHGNVVFQDLELDKLKLLFKNPYRKQNQHKNPAKDTFYLVLQRNGFLALHRVNYDETGTPDTVVWTDKPKLEMSLTEKCQPLHDCPYMHMQQKGMLTVNWMARQDANGDGKYDWMEKNFLHLYDN